MVDPKIVRLISLLIAALLLTTACASRERKVARRTCRIAKQCSPEVYDAAYNSRKECVDHDMELLIDDLNQEASDSSEQCADAHLDWLVCATKEGNCSSIYYISPSKCDDEYSAWGKACNWE